MRNIILPPPPFSPSLVWQTKPAYDNNFISNYIFDDFIRFFFIKILVIAEVTTSPPHAFFLKTDIQQVIHTFYQNHVSMKESEVSKCVSGVV